MRTRFERFVAFAITLCAVLAPSVRAETFLTQDQALRVAFPAAVSIEKKLCLPTAAQRATLEAQIGAANVPRVFQCWVGHRADRVEGYAVIDDVLGKSEPITYMLVVDPSLRVSSVEILAYRESRGGEVRQPDWRAQFAGKNASSPLKVGQDIRNVAGATISCRAVTDGVRRQLVLLQALVGELRGESSRRVGAGSSEQPSAPDVARERTQILMGTTLRIRVEGVSDAVAQPALGSAFAEVARLEWELSTWREGTAVWKLNRGAGGALQEIPRDLADVLAASLDASRLSGGAFDVSAGPAIELWRAASARGSWPSDAEIAAARSLSGFELVELDREGPRARLKAPGARIDLGGIGKGFALDRARAVLERAGVRSALLDFGGQILALAAPPGESGWNVALRDPVHPERVSMTLRLVNASISTTADYERGFEVAGRRVSHVVDPRTGLPVEGMLGASVVCAGATEADALSKVPYVLGFERGLRFARDHGLAVMLVDGAGRVATTPQFDALVVARSEPPAPRPQGQSDGAPRARTSTSTSTTCSGTGGQ